LPAFYLPAWRCRFSRHPRSSTKEAKLTDGGIGGELSGSSVSISGDTAVMGAPAESSGRGAAYVFFRDVGGWTLQQKLEASDGLAGDSFGTSVSVSGDHVAIGAPGRSSGRGAVYTFSRTAGVWTQQPTPLTALDASVGDQLGFSVSLQGLTLVAGAPLDDVNGKADTGSRTCSRTTARRGASSSTSRSRRARSSRRITWAGRSRSRATPCSSVHPTMTSATRPTRARCTSSCATATASAARRA
jgi:hypothetical protein